MSIRLNYQNQTFLSDDDIERISHRVAELVLAKLSSNIQTSNKGHITKKKSTIDQQIELDESLHAVSIFTEDISSNISKDIKSVSSNEDIQQTKAKLANFLTKKE